jgi:uncharacterized protein (TIGR03435 family)
MTRTSLTIAALLTIAAAPFQAQETAPLSRFEVASVRRNNTGNQGPRFLNPMQGGLRAVNIPLSTLLWIAHGVQADQVVDVPDWARQEAFDIIAKVPDGAPLSMESMRPMLIDLLVERFQMKARHESREMPVYRLVRIRAGALGPQLKPSPNDCTDARRGGGPAGPPLPANSGQTCGAFTRPGGFSVHGLPLVFFTRLLAPITGRVVVDDTGLTGVWDLDVEFAPDGANARGGGPQPPAGNTGDAPSFFTAVQEQLGLKLEASRAPVDVVVIEHLARPTED